MSSPSQVSFRRIVEFILDNLFDLVTIGIAAYLVIHYQVFPATEGDLPTITTWILGVLGLLAVSGIWDRKRRLQRIENLVEESRNLIQHRLSGHVQANDFFLKENTITNKTFEAAHTIIICGFALTRTAREYNSILAQRLVAGASIRVMMIDPKREAVLAEASLKSLNAPAAHWRSRLEVTETALDAIAQTPGAKGKFEVGYLPYTPAFGFTMIDPDEPYGSTYIEMYHHKSVEFNATFELKASDDAYWFDFFHRQAKVLWQDCRVETLPHKP